ncbi:MAG: hypothetical protein ABSB24_13700, partial [Gaiellaceae bacterium]
MAPPASPVAWIRRGLTLRVSPPASGVATSDRIQEGGRTYTVAVTTTQYETVPALADAIRDVKERVRFCREC